jgi:hypothetical protein
MNVRDAVVNLGNSVFRVHFITGWILFHELISLLGGLFHSQLLTPWWKLLY